MASVILLIRNYIPYSQKISLLTPASFNIWISLNIYKHINKMLVFLFFGLIYFIKIFLAYAGIYNIQSLLNRSTRRENKENKKENALIFVLV